MRFAFTDDQKMLRDTVREVLQRECAPDVVRAAWEGRPERAGAVWKTLAETGVIGMTASEEAGGMAMREIDLVLPVEELGYAAMPGPLVDTVAVGIPLLEAAGTEAQKERWLRPAIAGEARIVVSFEDQPIVAHAASADVLIAERGGVAYCVPMSEVSVNAETSVDRTRELGRVSFEATARHQMREDVDAMGLFAMGRERATLGTAAQLIGLSRRMLDMAVQYAKDREQFGKADRRAASGKTPSRQRVNRAGVRAAHGLPRGLVHGDFGAGCRNPCFPCQDLCRQGCKIRGQGSASGPWRHRLHDRVRPSHVDEKGMGACRGSRGRRLPSRARGPAHPLSASELLQWRLAGDDCSP